MASLPLRQILSPERVDLYRANRCIGGFSSTTIQGFAHHPADTYGMTPERIWRYARPDHPRADGSPVPMPEGPLYVIDFQLGDESSFFVLPSNWDEELGVTSERFADPWLGTGVAASGPEVLVRERIVATPCDILPNAVISEIKPDGSLDPQLTLLVNAAGERRWFSTSGDSVPSPDAAAPNQRLFANAGGWLPAAVMSPGHLHILTHDERSARMRANLPGVLGPSGVLSTGGAPGLGWALVQETHIHRMWAVSKATIAGRDFDVQYAYRAADSTRLGLTWIGRPFPGMVELGFWGDQYSGFHAEVPWTLVEGFTTDYLQSAIDVDDAILPAPTLMNSIGSAPWADGYLHLDSAYLVANFAPEGTVVPVPDFRSADIMYPGHDLLTTLPDGTITTDLGLLHPQRLNIRTTATLPSGEQVVVLGTENDDYIIASPDEHGRLGDEATMRTVPRNMIAALQDEFLPEE